MNHVGFTGSHASSGNDCLDDREVHLVKGNLIFYITSVNAQWNDSGKNDKKLF